ncbi:hypothetical protein ACFL1H_03605 [Nanoarchaeota archaeon]
MKLSENNILTIEKSGAWMPGNSTMWEGSAPSSLLSYFEQLINHKVIEIGPGGHPVNKFYPCKEYEGVQPHECYVPNIGGEDYILNDGLSFLREQPDSSAVVISLGVLDTLVLNFNAEYQNLNYKYIEEFAEEIKRVMNPFAIISSADAGRFMGLPDIARFDDQKYVGGIYFKK